MCHEDSNQSGVLTQLTALASQPLFCCDITVDVFITFIYLKQKLPHTQKPAPLQIIPNNHNTPHS